MGKLVPCYFRKQQVNTGWFAGTVDSEDAKNPLHPNLIKQGVNRRADSMERDTSPAKGQQKESSLPLGQ